MALRGGGGVLGLWVPLRLHTRTPGWRFPVSKTSGCVWQSLGAPEIKYAAACHAGGMLRNSGHVQLGDPHDDLQPPNVPSNLVQSVPCSWK